MVNVLSNRRNNFVICKHYWGGVCCVCSPSLSFLLQNLKVQVPDEISLELGRVLLSWVSISAVSTV